LSGISRLHPRELSRAVAPGEASVASNCRDPAHQLIEAYAGIVPFDMTICHS
jgi:hypothetical protein